MESKIWTVGMVLMAGIRLPGGFVVSMGGRLGMREKKGGRTINEFRIVIEATQC